MGKGIHDRLKQIRTHFGLSIREFAKKINYSHSLYGQVEYGNREPTERILDLIIAKFNVNKEWIITGKGEMFSEIKDLRIDRILEIYNKVDDSLKNALLAQSEILYKLYRKDD